MKLEDFSKHVQIAIEEAAVGANQALVRYVLKEFFFFDKFDKDKEAKKDGETEDNPSDFQSLLDLAFHPENSSDENRLDRPFLTPKSIGLEFTYFTLNDEQKECLKRTVVSVPLIAIFPISFFSVDRIGIKCRANILESSSNGLDISFQQKMSSDEEQDVGHNIDLEIDLKPFYAGTGLSYIQSSYLHILKAKLPG